MAGAWERRETVLGVVLHTDNTTIAWAFGLRNIILPPGSHFIGLAGMPFDHARNQGAMHCLDHGFDYCLYLDSDVIPPSDAVLKLMSRRKPIISGVYHRRSPPEGVPVMLKGGKWIQNYKPNTIMEVDLVGAGCLLVHRSVFQTLPQQREGKHWFDWRVDMQSVLPQGAAMSEDFTFCQHAKSNGFKIYVDTSVVCKHIGFGEAHHRRFVPLAM